MLIEIARLDVAPASIPWWRAMDGIVSEQKSAADSLNNNNVADYKQMNASLEGVLQQYKALLNYVGSIPTTETRSNEVSGWGVPEFGDNLLATQTFTVPSDKNYVTASAVLDATPGASGGHVTGYLTIDGVQSGHPGVPSGGSAAISISLGFSFAAAAGSSFNINYYVTAAGSIATPASANNQANCNSLVTYSRR